MADTNPQNSNGTFWDIHNRDQLLQLFFIIK